MSGADYYEVLGVNKSSTQEEIKKAYRKMAIEHHPDKGGSEDNFKKITEAYEVLGDENKKLSYDNKGNNPFEHFNGGGHNPFEDMFGNMFYNKRKKTVPDKIIEISLSVVESYLGAEKTISYLRNFKCDGCNGSGGDRTMCSSCGGQGFTIIRTGTGLFVQIVRQICQQCKGVGQIVHKKCFKCNGLSIIPKMDQVNIQIPHGVDDGNFFRMEEKGDYIQGMYGNLVIKIKIISENNFEKHGNDLIYNAFLNYNQLKDDSISIPHPSGQMLIKLPQEFDTSKPLRIKSKGFQNGSGDLYVKLFVKFDRTNLTNNR